MSPSFSWKAFSLPLLFTAFVLLHFYLTNYIEVNFSEFLFVALLLMGLIAAIELCLWKWLKDMDRVGLTTALGTFFFFSYERIVYAYHRFDQRVGAEIALVGTADPSHATRVACLWILAGLTLAGGVLLFRLKVNLKGLVRFGFLCSVGAILITGTFGAINLAGQLRPRLDLPRAGQAASSKPDIYVILLDAFGRPDMLERDYGVRTAPFVAALQKLGFKVFSESLANYPTTSYALACELNYAYIDQQSMGIPADYKSGYPLLSLVHSNRVTRFLREQGYEVVNIYGGVHFTRAFESTTRRLGSGRSVNGFFYVFFKHTPVDVLAPDLLTVPELDLRRSILLQGLEELRTLPPGDKPRFVMLHVLCPHHPFFVDAQGGRPHADPSFDWEGRRDHRTGYAGQAEFLQKQVEPIVSAILKSSPREPVILIQGDHGPVPILEEGPGMFQQRYRNLCALYLPGQDYRGIPEDLSPVNYFRVIFNRFFGTNLELLPNKSFYLLDGVKVFQFTDITEDVKGTRR